jgi:hypothetical protein
LERVYVPGSAALATESARLRSLLDQRLVVRGLDLQVLAVRPLSVEADRAVLEVTDRLPAYDLLDATGRLRAHHAARSVRRWRIELADRGTSWRIAAVEAMAGAARS